MTDKPASMEKWVLLLLTCICIQYWTITGTTGTVLECRSPELGDEYMYQGTQNVTNGYTCKPWTDHTWRTSVVPDNFPDATVEDAMNYCRNPDGDSTGLWCWVAADDFEYCEVPLCECSNSTVTHCQNNGTCIDVTETTYACDCSGTGFWGDQCQFNHTTTTEEATTQEATTQEATTQEATTQEATTMTPTECLQWMDSTGEQYMGNTDVAEDGTPCSAWTDYFSDSDFPDGSRAAAGNKCRNPDYAGDGENTGPWCFFGGFQNWDYCDISLCGETADLDCLEEVEGANYTGNISVTQDGEVCDAWEDYLPGADFPDGSLAAASNFCRNPDSDDRPWCPVANDGYRYCDIADCDGAAQSGISICGLVLTWIMTIAFLI